MQKLRIAGTDLQVSRIGLGTDAWGSSRPVEDANRLLESYLAAGGNLLDSAHCYAFWLPGGDGQSERTLGELVRRHQARQRVVVCTKGGTCDAGPQYPRPRQCLRADLLRRDVEQSLERLGFDQIDLYFLHRDDGITPVAEVIETLNELIGRRQLRWIAASNWSTRRIEQANAYATQKGLCGFCASQVQWSLATPNWQVGEDPVMRHLTAEDRAWHAQKQIPVLAYSSTAGGFFSGVAADGGVFNTAANHRRLERAGELASKIGCTPGQLALAWLMNQPFAVVPLTGTGSVEHLRQSMAATDIRLTAEQVQWLERG